MESDEPQKIGQGHVKAMMRQGTKELSQVLPAFPNGSIQPVEEPGLAGNLTPQEIVNSKGVHGSYQSALDGYTAHGRTAPQQEQQRTAGVAER